MHVANGNPLGIVSAMKAERAYLICTSPRSGSTLLAEGLRSTGVAGNPQEWFSPLATRDNKWVRNLHDLNDVRSWHLELGSDSEFLQRVMALGSTPNGTFGAKLHLGQIPEIKRRLRNHHGDPVAAFGTLLARTFPEVRFIWLRRRDKAAQAISAYRAIKSGEFVKMSPTASPSSSDASAEERDFDIKEVHRYADLFTGQDAMWEQIFPRLGTEPLVIDYEELASHYTRTMQQVLEFLQLRTITQNELRPVTLRQADALSARWHERFTARYPTIHKDSPEQLQPWLDALLN